MWEGSYSVDLEECCVDFWSWLQKPVHFKFNIGIRAFKDNGTTKQSMVESGDQISLVIPLLLGFNISIIELKCVIETFHVIA